MDNEIRIQTFYSGLKFKALRFVGIKIPVLFCHFSQVGTILRHE
jgi:hypothetical protein